MKNLITIFKVKYINSNQITYVIKSKFEHTYFTMFDNGQNTEYTENEFKEMFTVVDKKVGNLELFSTLFKKGNKD